MSCDRIGVNCVHKLVISSNSIAWINELKNVCLVL